MNKLSGYIEISSYNENTTLVQKDDRIYVKKRIPRELAYIYKILVCNHHKNISDIVEVFEYQDCAVVIEKYISGDSLSDILSRQGTLSEIQTKNIIGQICDGLLFLHKHNIIHRDINPNNIIISDNNQVKIIDFDISRTTKKNMANDTVILGTAGYAAPEQFGFSQSDMRTDIYAVGVLANVMLTGEMPNKRLYEGRLGKIIRKATAIDADIRYKNISSFKLAFTNETDENTNCVIKVLRCVPGFRTWEVWKMLIAVIFYGTYIPLMGVFISWSCTSFIAFLRTVFSEILMFVVPFVLLTNVLGIRNRLAHKPFKALIISIIISIIAFVIGAFIFLLNMA